MGKERGKLIVFEGTDGTGKSTQLSLLSDYLQQHAYPVVTTREPTDGPFGQKIRALYQNRGNCTPRQELDLFIADRKEHIDQLIEPALTTGKIVLCDRYYLSTIAYQGAIGFEIAELVELNSFAPVPDVALLFQASLDTSQERITAGRGDTLNDFEQIENLKKVSAIFDSLNMPFIERINAQGSIEEVHKSVLEQVQPILPETLKSVA